MKLTKSLKLVLALALVSVVMIALVACGTTQLATPTNVRYDGATITWNAVEGATGYTVQINDGNEYTVTTTSYSHIASGENFSVTVKAVGSSKKTEPSAAATQSFVPLGNVSEVRFDEFGVASWDVVESATAYAIRIDGVEVTTVTATNYAEIPVGPHSFQVRPVVSGNNTYYSSWSKPYNTNILGTVSKDDITYDNGLLKWKTVTGALGYEVLVNGVTIAEKNSGTSINYDANNTGFEVNIRAKGNGTSSFTGELSETKTFIFLDTVTNVTVEDGILKWDAVGGADGYYVKTNGRETKVTTNEYTGLPANVSTDVIIKPYSLDSTYISDWSQVKSIFLLPAPTLQWNQDYELDGEPNNNAYWDGISSAAGYTVRLTTPTGKVTTREYGSTERSFAEAYLEVGTYTVELKANAPEDSTTVYDSLYSQPIKVIRLATPKAASQNFITSDPSSLAKGFTVTFEKIAGATRYELIKDNTSFKHTNTNQFIVGDLVENNVTEEQNFTFAIRALGGVQPVNGQIVATLGSLTQDALTFNIKILPAPTNPVMVGFKYTYGTIAGADGYIVDVGGSSFTSINGEYDLSVLEAGNFEVKVCARGNGNNILASNYTAPTNVHRLSPPTNVRISIADGSEGEISFDEVMHAQGYYIVYNNDGNALPVSNMMNINQYITEIPGTDIHLFASANYYSDDGTVYYMTSNTSTTFRCVKLSAPTFGDLAFNNNQFYWKSPANTNTSIYTPTYVVYDESEVAYNGEKNGTTMDISYLEGGREYVFMVKAVGNGINYINSNISEPVRIYKLATPEVYRENGKYMWNAVARANSYAVYVDGVLKGTYPHEPGKTYDFTPDFTELKKYTVEVVAIGDGGYTTINSNHYTIVQETKQLTSPDFTVSYTDERYSETGAVVVTITKQPDYATGYSYTIGGTTHTSSETTYSLVPSSVGTVEVRVFALGGSFDENGIYYLPSQSVGGANKAITLLASPNASSFQISHDGVLTWAAIAGAKEYEVILNIDGVETVIKTKTPSYNIENFKDATTIIVKIAAVGNGTNTVSSVYTEKRWDR